MVLDTIDMNALLYSINVGFEVNFLLILHVGWRLVDGGPKWCLMY